jgi:hypothetical protein
MDGHDPILPRYADLRSGLKHLSLSKDERFRVLCEAARRGDMDMVKIFVLGMPMKPGVLLHYTKQRNMDGGRLLLLLKAILIKTRGE